MDRRCECGEIIILSPLVSLFSADFFSICLLTVLIKCMLNRRAEIEVVMDLAQVLKDQWVRFSAPLFMRRSREMIRKVLETSILNRVVEQSHLIGGFSMFM